MSVGSYGVQPSIHPVVVLSVGLRCRLTMYEGTVDESTLVVGLLAMSPWRSQAKKESAYMVYVCTLESWTSRNLYR